MKKILMVFFILCNGIFSFAEGEDTYSFLGNFFSGKKEKKISQPKRETSAIQTETQEVYPANLEFTYIDGKTKESRVFYIKIQPVKKGDYRPADIAAVEDAIYRETVREKILPMMKYYEKAFNEYLEKISDNSEKIYQLGNQYFINRRYEKARDIFSKNIDTIDNLFGAAITNRFLGYDRTAIDYYSEIIYREPKIAEPYLGRGICYRNLGQYKEALSDFLKYKSMKNTEEAYTSLGNIYILREEYEKAQRILQEGRVLYPNSKLINDLLIRAYAK